MASALFSFDLFMHVSVTRAGGTSRGSECVGGQPRENRLCGTTRHLREDNVGCVK
jgi:hypothetical protein